MYVDVDGVVPLHRRGDRVDFVADLAPPQLFRNDVLPSPWPRAALEGVVLSGNALSVRTEAEGRGPLAVVDRVRHFVRSRIVATFGRASGLGRALILGEADVSEETAAAFRASGLSHLLAVSGTHLVVAMALIGRALRPWTRLAARYSPQVVARSLEAAVLVPMPWVLAEFTGGSGSAWRAAAASTLVLVARAAGRTADPRRTYCVSATALLLMDPLLTYDLSFALSMGACGGLLVTASPGSTGGRAGGGPSRAVASAVRSAVGATLGTAPILVCIGSDVPLAGAIVTPFAALLGETVALPACMLHAVSAAWPDIEQRLAWVGGGALYGLERLAVWVADVSPALRVPSPSGAVLGLGALAAVLFVARPPQRHRWWVWGTRGAWIGAWAASANAGTFEARPLLELRVFDVGQGDCTLVRFADGSTMLIDGGGLVGSPFDVGERIVVPALRAMGLHRIDTVLLTHLHPDHAGGLAAVVREMDVGTFWSVAPLAPPDDTERGRGELREATKTQATARALDALSAELRRKGVATLYPPDVCGRHTHAGVELTVLAPCPEPDGTLSANDNSFVLRMRAGHRVMLWTGDAELEAERRLLDGPVGAEQLGADVLKLGHHGSRTSSSGPFLDAVGPAAAVVSSGLRNRFGHPHRETRESLRSRAIPLYRTDRVGALRVTTDGESMWIAPTDARRVDGATHAP
jgi:competence protein ComEC